MKQTKFLLRARLGAGKYPTLVSYNKLPWQHLHADTPELHNATATHYTQLFKLAAQADIPYILNDFHLEIPEEEWLVTLPSTIYILPGVASQFNNDPKEFGPYNWPYQHVTDSVSLQYYAPLEAASGTTISDVITYKSPDLRVICNAIVFRPGSTASFAEGSTFGKIAEAAKKAGSKTMPDFVLFHFYRPNRPQAELSTPLKRFFRHPLALSTSTYSNFSGNKTNGGNSNSNNSALDIFGLSAKWEPVLEQPSSAKSSKLTAPKAFRPPTSYLPGLYERLALKPGDAFGKRSLMWGSYF